MANLLLEYEQQFATLIAEITSKICLLNSKDKDDTPLAVHELEKVVEESRDLLERMELEVREGGGGGSGAARVTSHKAEFARLQADWARSRHRGERAELLSDGEAALLSDNAQQQLLADGDKLELTSDRLKRSYQVSLETESIGAELLGDLHSQRQSIQHARNRLREADADLDQSSRTLNSMLRLAVQHRFIVASAVVVVTLVLMLALYVSLA